METLERVHRALRAMMMSRLPGAHAESELTLATLSVFMMAPLRWTAVAPPMALGRYLASEGVDRLRRPFDVDMVRPASELIGGTDVDYQRAAGVLHGRRGQFA
jgi:hypothetical protein